MTFVNVNGQVMPSGPGGWTQNPANVRILTSVPPSSAATSEPIGTIGVYPATGAVYIVAANTGINGTVTWSLLGGASSDVNTINSNAPVGGNYVLAGTANQISKADTAGTTTFSLPATIIAPGSLEVTTTLTVDGSGTSAIGTSNTATTVNIANGTGGNIVAINNGVNTVANTVEIANGASAANSTVSILSGVGTAGAGTLALGNNTRVTTIDVGNIAPAAARTTTIAGGNSAQNDTVNILGGAPSAGTQTVHILDGTSTGGTQNVIIGNNAQAANTVTIVGGATNGVQVTGKLVASTTLTATLGDITASNGDFVASTAAKGPKVVGTSVTGATPQVNSVRAGQVGFSDVINAAATGALVLTNTLVTAASVIIANTSCATVGSACVIRDIVPGVGTVTFNVTNLGGTNTGTTIFINFWVLN